MASSRPRCEQIDCFQNKCGARCELLDDQPSTQPCPFFKTKAEAEEGRLKAHKRLVELGMTDLITKYEYNPLRRGQW